MVRDVGRSAATAPGRAGGMDIKSLAQDITPRITWKTRNARLTGGLAFCVRPTTGFRTNGPRQFS
jgi:hypothetical protein